MLVLVLWLFFLLPNLPVDRFGSSTLLLIRVVLAPSLLILRIEASIVLLRCLVLSTLAKLGLVGVFAGPSRLLFLLTLIRVLLSCAVLRVILDVLFLVPRLASFASFSSALT